MITISQSPAVQASLSETTHMAHRAEAVQVSLNSFQGLASKEVREQGADKHRRRRLIPSQWSFDISTPSSKPRTPVTRWHCCCGNTGIQRPPGRCHSLVASSSSGFQTKTVSLQSAADHWAAVENTKCETGNTHKESRHALAPLLTFHTGTSEVSFATVTPPARALCPLACSLDWDRGQTPLTAS